MNKWVFITRVFSLFFFKLRPTFIALLLLCGSILNVSLPRRQRTLVVGRSARPTFIYILKLQTDEAEIAATLAGHVLAPIDVVDEYPTSGTRPRAGTPGHRRYRLRAAFFQLLQLRRLPVALVVPAAVEARPPPLSAVPAERHFVSGLSRTLVADDAVPVVVPGLGEVSLLVRAALDALAQLRLSLDEVLVDGVERSQKFFLSHHGCEDVSNDHPLHGITARRTVDPVAAVFQRDIQHTLNRRHTFTMHRLASLLLCYLLFRRSTTWAKAKYIIALCASTLRRSTSVLFFFFFHHFLFSFHRHNPVTEPGNAVSFPSGSRRSPATGHQTHSDIFWSCKITHFTVNRDKTYINEYLRGKR